MNPLKPAKTAPPCFTLREATEMLPLVQMIVTDIVALSDEVEQTRERLACLGDGRMGNSDQAIYRNEVLSIQQVVDQKSDVIDGCVKELEELNLLPRREPDSMVDFPAMRRNEPVCLCWKLGESEVRYWHGVDEDCSQRRPVDLDLIRQSGDHAFV